MSEAVCMFVCEPFCLWKYQDRKMILFSPPQNEIYYLVDTPESDGVAIGVSTLYMQMQCLTLIYCTAKWYWCY